MHIVVDSCILTIIVFEIKTNTVQTPLGLFHLAASWLNRNWTIPCYVLADEEPRFQLSNELLKNLSEVFLSK